MTITIAVTNPAGSGVRYTLGASDLLYVGAGVVIGSSDGLVIYAGNYGASMLIDGTVLGGSDFGAIAASNSSITIGGSGTVFSQNTQDFTTAILVSDYSNLSNAGSIVSTGGLGVYMSGSLVTLANSGRIEGAGGGVLIRGSSVPGTSLTNTGSIIAGTAGATDLRLGHGIQIEGHYVTVLNAGLVLANGVNKAGLHLGGDMFVVGDARITNEGSITSTRFWGVDGGDSLAGFILHNSGTIQGATGAVRGSAQADYITNTGVMKVDFDDAVVAPAVFLGDGTDTLINRGTILGDVDLGDGDDSYFGQTGSLQNGVFGGAGEDVITGGQEAESFSGGSEDDTLRGNGGDDSLLGEAGDDELYGGAGDDLLFGGEGNDLLSGGAGDDLLFGGSENDTLIGGAGDDFYFIVTAGTRVREAVGGGNDTVASTAISLNLAAYANVENAGLSGSDNLNLTGSALDNELAGNDGANRIDGGAGADTMIGGLGNDVYIVDQAGDVVIEDAGGGTDRVSSSTISLNLAAYANVEYASLLGSLALNLTGNGAANTLTGNSAANLLTGGAGRDRLTGGGGADTFVFTAATDSGPSALSYDTITDFTPGTDRIDLSAIDASSLHAGDQAFVFSGNSALVGIAGQLAYNEGRVRGDLDGDGFSDFEIFLTGAPALTEADFLL